MKNEEIEEDYMEEFDDERDYDGGKGHRCQVPSIKINCDLEVNVGSKNKIIYVCSGKLQYFTASAICCSSSEEIEIVYCGRNAKCICNEVVIRGCLGFYKIVKSGIIFIPRHKLYKLHQELFPTDVLCFIARDKNGKEVKFDVVFTYSKCGENEYESNRCCKCN